MTKTGKEKQHKDKQKHGLKETEIKINGTGEGNGDEHSAENSTDENPAEENNNKLNLQIQDLRDQLLRKAAEFENYKRRTDAEKSDFFAYASERLISELLPVIDDFNRILKAYDDKHDAESFKKGVELVYEKFRNILSKQGLKEMESDGKEFDVNLHEALLQQPDENSAENTILNTPEKGYFLKDKVLRHAKVIVSAGPDSEN